MGTETEIKLEVTSQEQLDRALEDLRRKACLAGPFLPTQMQTVYYDTAQCILSRKRWTLRLRKEGDVSVATLKIPLSGQGGLSVRGEWQCRAGSIEEAIPGLLQAGAPAHLCQLLDGEELQPLCGARFTRQAAPLCFPDGSQAELAVDKGVLTGSGREQEFCEVELELLAGAPEAMTQLADYLARTYQMAGQPLSKFARARDMVQSQW